MLLRTFSICLQRTSFVCLPFVLILSSAAKRLISSSFISRHSLRPTRKVLLVPAKETFLFLLIFLMVAVLALDLPLIASHISFLVMSRVPLSVLILRLTMFIFRARSLSSFLSIRSHFFPSSLSALIWLLDKGTPRFTTALVFLGETFLALVLRLGLALTPRVISPSL